VGVGLDGAEAAAADVDRNACKSRILMSRELVARRYRDLLGQTESMGQAQLS
jgi:hypothetical protein